MLEVVKNAENTSFSTISSCLMSMFRTDVDNGEGKQFKP